MAVENVRIVYAIEDSELDALIAKFGKLTKEEQEQIRLMQKIDTQTTQTVNNQNNQYNGLNKTIANVRNTIIAAFALDKIISFGKEVINTTATFQKFEAVLTNTLGSNSKAQNAMQMLVDFATKTPFAVEELTASFVKLANAGFKPTESEMTKLGDLASSTGKSFDQLTEAILDAQVGEFERLKEFGVRANKEGDNVRFTFKGVETQVKGTEYEIRKYILSLGNLQGVSGSMSAISKTLGGQISNLGDSFTQLQNAIGQRFSSQIGFAVNVLNNLVQGITSFVQGNKETKSSVELAVLAVQKEKTELNDLVKAIRDQNISNEARQGLISELNTKFPEFAKSIDVVKASEKELEKALIAVNKQFDLQVFNVATTEIRKKYNKELAELVSEEIELVKRIEKVRRGDDEFRDFNEKERGGIAQSIQNRLDYMKVRRKVIEDGQDIEIEVYRKYLQDRNLTEKEANALALKVQNDSNKDKVSIDKKHQEELAKQQAEFALRELEAQQKLAENKIKIEIENNNYLRQKESLTYIEKLDIIRKNNELELELIKLQTKNSLETYEIDKNNKVVLTKKTESERLIILQDSAQKELELSRKTANELKAIEPKTLESRLMSNVDFQKKMIENAEKALKKLQDLKDREVELEREKESKKQAIKEKAFELGNKITETLFNINSNNITKEIERVQAQKDYELQLAGDNKNKQIEINNRYAEKDKELKRKQAQAEKDKAIFDIFVSTSVAAVKALPNIPLSILIGSLGLLNLLQVSTKPIPKFRRGIDYLDLPTNGTDADGMIIEAHKGERILPTHLNDKIKHIPNSMIPQLVLLGQSKAETKSISPNELAKAIGSELKKLPINSIQLNENGFEKWVIENGNSQKVFNKNTSW